jgi:hypothetical protein
MVICKACHKTIEAPAVIGYVDLATYCSMECYGAYSRMKKVVAVGKSAQQTELEKTLEGSCVFLKAPENK